MPPVLLTTFSFIPDAPEEPATLPTIPETAQK
jgi:hypothetical protein